MSIDKAFEVRRFDFNDQLIAEFRNVHYAKDFWPIVYILSDGSIGEAYIGETTDAYARMNSHLSNNAKNKLTNVHLITSDKFNKSATLDIESNLIRYIAADGQFKLINGNIGLANHNYYQKKEVYWEIFVSIWNKLRKEGISKHSIEYIDNSNLFKYSPYKCLSSEQRQGLKVIMKSLLLEEVSTIVVEGGAGTGKTILAIFLFKLLNSKLDDFNLNEFGEDEVEFISLIEELKQKFPKPSMALVIPMASFRKTVSKVFKNIKGLSPKMVVGPAEIANEKYDIIVVDESHRLRRRVNLGTYFGSFDKICERLALDKYSCSELDWITLQSKKAILFYDDRQSIKPSDARKEDFDKLKSEKTTKIEYLKSQFRVKGGNSYVDYIDKLLSCTLPLTAKVYNDKEYEFVLFESVGDLVNEIKKRDDEHHLARLIAGYSWPWISQKDKTKFDINIGEVQLQWNGTNDDWINSPNAVSEVGCIHTTQGYDLNYAGVIFGNEITYNKESKQIEILKECYFDRNGKNSITDPNQLKSYIVNIYKTIMLRGIKGTYIYVCNEALREYFKQHIALFGNKNSVKFLPLSDVIPYSNAVPVYDFTAAAGAFSELQIVNLDNKELSWVEIPTNIKNKEELFACTIKGESMNKIIPNGSICLFRQYTGGSRNGKIVLVESLNIQDPDFGAGYTVKEYHSVKNMTVDTWRHNSIVLKPLSNDPEFQDIVLLEDQVNSLRVIGVFEMVLG